MITFCKKSVHSFLGLSNSQDNYGTRSRNIPSPANGLSLLASITESTRQPANVVESSTVVKSTPSSPAKTGPTVLTKKDRAGSGIGFIDEVGGGVDGLMSCTESLGFESSDERRTDEQMDQDIRDNDELNSRTRSTVNKPEWGKKVTVRREVKKLPPPLSSMNRYGQPSFYLRPVRKDGRLKLIEIRIDRPEFLRASRQDGRLRLHLIENEEVEEEEDVDDIEEEIEEKIEEEKINDERKLPVTNGGDGFRRCYEMVNHHHHHHHNRLWSQNCVTSR